MMITTRTKSSLPHSTISGNKKQYLILFTTSQDGAAAQENPCLDRFRRGPAQSSPRGRRVHLRGRDLRGLRLRSTGYRRPRRARDRRGQVRPYFRVIVLSFWRSLGTHTCCLPVRRRRDDVIVP